MELTVNGMTKTFAGGPVLGTHFDLCVCSLAIMNPRVLQDYCGKALILKFEQNPLKNTNAYRGRALAAEGQLTAATQSLPLARTTGSQGAIRISADQSRAQNRRWSLHFPPMPLVPARQDLSQCSTGPALNIESPANMIGITATLVCCPCNTISMLNLLFWKISNYG